MFILFLVTVLSPLWCLLGWHTSHTACSNAMGAFVHPNRAIRPSAQLLAVQSCLPEEEQSPELRYLHGRVQAKRQQLHLVECGQKEMDSVMYGKVKLAAMKFLTD